MPSTVLRNQLQEDGDVNGSSEEGFVLLDLVVAILLPVEWLQGSHGNAGIVLQDWLLPEITWHEMVLFSNESRFCLTRSVGQYG